MGGVSTPVYRPLLELVTSPEDVYPLLLLHTEPSEPAGLGVGEMALAPPTPLAVFPPLLPLFPTGEFC